MLITEIKSKETIASLTKGKKVFLILCQGCMEVHFPYNEAQAVKEELAESVTGCITTDYICNLDNLKLRLKKHEQEIADSDAILVFSCGVGVQTVSALFEDKPVFSACDTLPLPGFQGVTPLEVDCGQCGECYLNLTGGICPITACSKSLLNGQCGGTKNGMCEVDPEMECGWERIYRRLAMLGRLDKLNGPVQIRNYATDDETAKKPAIEG